MSTVNWHPHARRNVLLWTIFPAALAVTAFGGLAMAFKGLPVIALGAVVVYAANIWFAGHPRLLRKLGAQPTNDPVIVNAVRELCRRGDIPVPEIYLSPDASPNAFAITSSKGSAFCVTRGLRALLDERETRAVLGHELAHIRNRDSVFSLLFMSVTNAITITMITSAALLALAIASSNDRRRRKRGEAIAVGVLVGGLGLLVARALFAAASRVRERLADHDGAQLTRDPLALASALTKLEQGATAVPMTVPTGAGAVAALCIINPLRVLLSTHPPTHRRVHWVQALARQQQAGEA
jgi:heat shock protein HtpX